jgi:hypothetical protein
MLSYLVFKFFEISGLPQDILKLKISALLIY